MKCPAAPFGRACEEDVDSTNQEFQAKRGQAPERRNPNPTLPLTRVLESSRALTKSTDAASSGASKSVLITGICR